MGVRDACTHLQEQPHALGYRKPALGAIAIDGHAFHVLHHEVEQVICCRARVQQSRDVRVLEPGKQFPLAHEPIAQGKKGNRQQLDGHLLGKGAVAAFG